MQHRLEIETRRSIEGLRRIADKLRAEGLLPEPAGGPGGGEDDAPFAPLDLKLIHKRRIARERLLASDLEGTVVCEIALDVVTFPVGSRTVRHHEVEIESLPAGTDEDVAELSRLLASAHPELRAWPWSKLQPGAVLLAMAREGSLPGEGSAVRRYDEIEARLRRESFRAVDGARR